MRSSGTDMAKGSIWFLSQVRAPPLRRPGSWNQYGEEPGRFVTVRVPGSGAEAASERRGFGALPGDVGRDLEHGGLAIRRDPASPRGLRFGEADPELVGVVARGSAAGSDWLLPVGTKHRPARHPLAVPGGDGLLAERGPDHDRGRISGR